MSPTLSFSGSPIISPEIITTYTFLFFGLLILTYTLLHYKFKPVLLHHHLLLFFFTSIGLKLALGVGGLFLSTYWLVPVPQVVATSPSNGYSTTTTRNKIEITFNRPVTRQPIQKTITPDAVGTWIFEEPVYGTHLYYKLVFYPSYSLNPNTTYTVTIENIKNLAQFSDPIDYQFAFTTQPIPAISNIIPSKNQENIEINDPITITLDHPNNLTSEFSYIITPDINLDIIPDETNQIVRLIPLIPFQQGTHYQLHIYQTPLQWDLSSNTVAVRGSTQLIHQTSFTTKQAPGITSVSPSGSQILTHTPITITFTEPMDRDSVQQNFTLSPSAQGHFTWSNDHTFTYIPNRLQHNTTYQISLNSGTKTLSGGYLEQPLSLSFTTLGHVAVTHTSPGSEWTGVDIKTPIHITFNQPVDRTSAQHHFSITPAIDGHFFWQDNTLIFTPAQNYQYSTLYKVSFSPGIKSINGLDSIHSFDLVFTTKHQVVKLNIPPYLQKHALSCEVATLHMALSYRGIDISEGTLLHQLGFDPTPKTDTTWGNPHQAFVGNVDGKQMKTGYGVYWGPIARVGRNYRQSQEFSAWTISQLTQEINNNNPVIIWGYSRGGSPTTWNTPDGFTIHAVSGEHTYLVTGFVGQVHNPVQIILNDPLIGEIYMPISQFIPRWHSLGNSGVVVH